MTKKIYVSQSTQHGNVGVGQYGTECDRMGRVANGVVRHLERNGFAVLRNNGNMTLAQTVADSNNRGANLHVACHTNANDTKSRGCEVWYKTAAGKAIAAAMYDKLSPVTPTSDRGIKQTDGFYELNNTKATSCLIEFMFHDNPDDATFVINHMEELAVVVAKGVCAYYGQAYIPLPEAAAPVTPAPAAEDKHLYRVQVGAFGVKANADNLAAELKAKGYPAEIIVD